jgi:hypothetical protein
MKIIRAIVAGERDPQVLAAMRDGRCKASVETINAALSGNYHGDCGVEFMQREELAIARAREDPSLHHEHAHLYGGFIFCVIRPSR